MRRSTPWMPLIATLLLAVPATAQNDRAAGLFTEARQLPLVSQSVLVRIDGADAAVELTQVFANDGDGVAQADYRLHLPDEATVAGFGFWRGDRFLEARLQETEEARRAHERAASEGRATGLVVQEGRVHSFSVYPLEAGALQAVRTTLRLPVTREQGRSHVRLPLDTFLGHRPLTASVLVHLETPERLRKMGVEGAEVRVLAQEARRARLAFSSDAPAEIWWREEAPPLLTRAEAVPLDDGSLALQLRVLLDAVPDAGPAYRELVLLVDGSESMRRRGSALVDAVRRAIAQSAAPVRVVLVSESSIEVDPTDRARLASALLGKNGGFGTTWDDLTVTASAHGCGDGGVRCLALTDPQVPGLPEERAVPFETLFLADADEIAHFETILGETAVVHQPDGDPRGQLMARIDEMVLPVLELRAVQQPGETLEIPGRPRARVAEGGMLRIFGRTRSTEPLEVTYTVGERTERRTVTLELLDPATRSGRGVRRGLYAVLLDAWTTEYRRSRDPELRRQIVEVSLREEIPTAFTSLQVADDLAAAFLPAGATPAPLLRSLGAILLLLGAMGLVLARIRSW